MWVDPPGDGAERAGRLDARAGELFSMKPRIDDRSASTEVRLLSREIASNDMAAAIAGRWPEGPHRHRAALTAVLAPAASTLGEQDREIER